MKLMSCRIGTVQEFLKNKRNCYDVLHFILKDGMVALTLVNEEQCTCYTEVGDRAK
jgi:hypothetical protein